MSNVWQRRCALREITGPTEEELSEGLAPHLMVGGFFPDVPGDADRIPYSGPGNSRSPGLIGYRQDASPDNIGAGRIAVGLISETSWAGAGRGRGFNYKGYDRWSAAGQFTRGEGFRAGLADSYITPVGGMPAGAHFDESAVAMGALTDMWSGAGTGRGFNGGQVVYDRGPGDFTLRKGFRTGGPIDYPGTLVSGGLEGEVEHIAQRFPVDVEVTEDGEVAIFPREDADDAMEAAAALVRALRREGREAAIECDEDGTCYVVSADDSSAGFDDTWAGSGPKKGFNFDGYGGAGIGFTRRSQGMKGSYRDGLGDPASGAMTDLYTGAGTRRGFNFPWEYGKGVGDFTLRKGERGTWMDYPGMLASGALQEASEVEAKQEKRALKLQVTTLKAAESLRKWAEKNLIPVGDDLFEAVDGTAFGYVFDLPSANDRAEAADRAREIAAARSLYFKMTGADAGWDLDEDHFIIYFSPDPAGVEVIPAEFSAAGIVTYNVSAGAAEVGEELEKPHQRQHLERKLQRLRRRAAIVEAKLASMGDDGSAVRGLLHVGHIDMVGAPPRKGKGKRPPPRPKKPAPRKPAPRKPAPRKVVAQKPAGRPMTKPSGGGARKPLFRRDPVKRQQKQQARVQKARQQGASGQKPGVFKQIFRPKMAAEQNKARDKALRGQGRGAQGGGAGGKVPPNKPRGGLAPGAGSGARAAQDAARADGTFEKRRQEWLEMKKREGIAPPGATVQTTTVAPGASAPGYAAPPPPAPAPTPASPGYDATDPYGTADAAQQGYDPAGYGAPTPGSTSVDPAYGGGAYGGPPPADPGYGGGGGGGGAPAPSAAPADQGGYGDEGYGDEGYYEDEDEGYYEDDDYYEDEGPEIYEDEDGNLVDADGNYVDEDGNLLEYEDESSEDEWEYVVVPTPGSVPGAPVVLPQPGVPGAPQVVTLGLRVSGLVDDIGADEAPITKRGVDFQYPL